MSHGKRIGHICLLLVALSLTACVPAAKIPLPTKEYGQIENSGNSTLLILLRGIGGKHTDFEKYGLIDEVRATKLPVDIVVPDAHYGYYKNETIAKRLKEDIIDPAKKRGYQEIWLAGFSMGGLGSLFYLREYAEDINRVMLISPFMGWASIRKEIHQANGIRNWQPETSRVDDWQFIIWKWVHQYTKEPGRYPPIYLGYGQNDSLASDGAQLLSEALESRNIFAVPGGHDYPTFKVIWSKHLLRAKDPLRKGP